MSEEQKLQTVDTYNPNDIIKGIEVSTAYIQGLQRMLTAMFFVDEMEAPNQPSIFMSFAADKVASKTYVCPLFKVIVI